MLFCSFFLVVMVVVCKGFKVFMILLFLFKCCGLLGMKDVVLVCFLVVVSVIVCMLVGGGLRV